MSRGLLIGLPTSVLYAWEATNGHPLGLTGHSVVYAVSVVPLGLAYMALICLFFLKNNKRSIFRIMAPMGRMALTNYLMQSVFGIIIFYGIGCGMGASTGLVYVEMAALGVFVLQICYSYVRLEYFRFGLLERLWRMLTYGKWLSLKK